jgi:hypothetical protein
LTLEELFEIYSVWVEYGERPCQCWAFALSNFFETINFVVPVDGDDEFWKLHVAMLASGGLKKLGSAYFFAITRFNPCGLLAPY